MGPKHQQGLSAPGPGPHVHWNFHRRNLNPLPLHLSHPEVELAHKNYPGAALHNLSLCPHRAVH